MKNPILILSFLLISCSVFSQDSVPVKHRIETVDGNIYNGTIVEETESIVKLSTKAGEITINKSTIRRRRIIDSAEMKNGKFWPNNPQSARYFFTPNGYGLEEEQAYYQNVMLFVNQFELGVTENFSIGAGIVPAFIYGVESPIWFTPNFSIPVVEDKVNVGVGGLFGTVIGLGSEGSFGLLYGNTTFGTRDSNISVGLGWGYAEGDFVSRPTFTVGGITRLGPRIFILGEFYNINDEFGGSTSLAVLGGRSLIRRVGLDYGMFMVIESDFFNGIPWLGVTVPLTKT